MSDYWELEHGLDALNTLDRNFDQDRNGDTNLDEYVNEL